MRYIFDVSFVGTNYVGFQAQPSGDSIQQTMGRALAECFGVECSVTGCSRTDSGVHANSFIMLIVAPDDAHAIPTEKIPQAMNRFLPLDISVKSVQIAPDDFHPRYSAHYKEYVYLIANGRVRDPFLHLRAHFVPRPLDVELMNEAAAKMVGRRDFRAFMASGSDIVDTVREVMYFDVCREGDLVRLRVAADGFLYNMVRIMSGTLVAVSDGKIKVDEIDGIIQSGDRRRAGATLPACGLYLNKVIY